MIANYHTHTVRCHHAVGSETDYIENAIRNGMKILGFADHTPYDTPKPRPFRMAPEELPEYAATLRALGEQYQDQIDILIGVEVEYYPTLFPAHLELLRDNGVQYMILGQHFVRDEQTGIPSFRRTEDPEALRQYYENVLAAAKTGRFLYIAHPDVFHFVGDETAYNELTADFLAQMKPLGIPLELNRLGFADGRHYPRRAFWEKCGEMGIPAVIGLDAHDPAVFQDEESVDRLIAFGRECGVRILPELELPDGYTE